MQRLVESLESGRGSAYAVDTTGSVYVENNAIARVIDRDMFGVGERLANQFIPATMTADGLLPRWEFIFGITPLPTDTANVRSARVASHWATIGVLNSLQPIQDAITAALGTVFVAILHIDPGMTGSVQYWPAGVTTQTGTNGVPIPAPPWFTNSAHIAIQVTQPAGYTNAQFYAAVGLIQPIVELQLPAWATWSWFRNNSVGVKGFRLDDPHNLDNEAFAT
jgi:hypothetical protein